MAGNPVITRFKRVKVAVAGLIIIVLVLLTAASAYIIAPDNTPYANNQQITLGNLQPGSSVNFIKIKKNRQPAERSFFAGFFKGFPSEYRYIPYKKFHISGDSIYIDEYGSTAETRFRSGFHVVDALYRIDSDVDIEANQGRYIFCTLAGKTQRISRKHIHKNLKEKIITRKTYLLGTDRFGRDMLSRIIVGSRISISVGFIAVGISLLVGIILGLTGGYFGGVTDRIVMWLINVVWSVPTLLLVIAISMVLGKGFWQIFVAVGLTMWVEVARVVRGQVKSIKQQDYVQAAKILGFPNLRIMFRHILPNTTGALIVISAANFATAILLEAGLSFLGIGVQPPMPSWGNMIRDHYGYIVVDQAYLAIVPGIAIMLLVWAFNVLGYGLRDAFDVKT